MLPCKLNPRSASIRATVRSLTRCQGLVNASARFRVDFVVQTSSDIGSPRVSGSTKALSCNNNPGSDSARLFRPPPGARTRTAGLRLARQPTGDRVRVHASSRRDDLDPTPAELLRLGPQKQSTLPLIHDR